MSQRCYIDDTTWSTLLQNVQEKMSEVEIIKMVRSNLPLLALQQDGRVLSFDFKSKLGSIPNAMAAYHEDVVDNWEDADTEDLERRMEERKNELKTELKVDNPPDTAQHKPESKEIEAQFVASLDPRLRIQDSERTQYVAPVKILKRTDATSGSPQGSSSPQQPGEEQKKYKSLAEREAEYASARARILGQSKPTGSQDVKILSTGQSQSSSPG